MPLKLIKIEPSTNKNKKYVAHFKHGEDGKIEKIHFGDSRYEDYTQHKNKPRRGKYRTRAKKGEDAKPNSASALSFHILWGNSTSFRQNLKDFIKKYNLR